MSLPNDPSLNERWSRLTLEEKWALLTAVFGFVGRVAELHQQNLESSLATALDKIAGEEF